METKELTVRNLVDAVPLYREMILENRDFDARLMAYGTGPDEIKKLISASVGQDEDVFILLYEGETAVGYMDATVVARGQEPEPVQRIGFVKSTHLSSGYRSMENLETLERGLVEKMKILGVSRMESNALIDDPEANRIWRSLGYVKVKNTRIKAVTGW